MVRTCRPATPRLCGRAHHPHLPAQPITSAAIVRGAIGVRHQRALEGLKALEAAGVVRRISETAWDQQYAADELFELLERYEEAIASGR